MTSPRSSGLSHGVDLVRTRPRALGRCATSGLVVAALAAATSLSGALGISCRADEPGPRLPFLEPALQRGSVWLDMDPAIGEPLRDPDDGWAYVHARATLGARLVGISLGYGNIADLDREEQITEELQGLFPSPALPVHRGAERAEDLDRETAASIAIAEQLGHEHLTLLALGRLTTVAHVIAAHPELRSRVDEVVMIGGRRLESEPTIGKDARILPDSNFAADMTAVRALLDSGVPLTLAPTDLALTVVIEKADLDALDRRGGASRYLAQRSRDWLELWTAVLGARGFSPFDSLATFLVASPAKVSCEVLPVAILDLPDRSFRGTGKQTPRVVVSPMLASSRLVKFCGASGPDAKGELLAALPGGP